MFGLRSGVGSYLPSQKWRGIRKREGQSPRFIPSLCRRQEPVGEEVCITDYILRNSPSVNMGSNENNTSTDINAVQT